MPKRKITSTPSDEDYEDKEGKPSPAKKAKKKKSESDEDYSDDDYEDKPSKPILAKKQIKKKKKKSESDDDESMSADEQNSNEDDADSDEEMNDENNKRSEAEKSLRNGRPSHTVSMQTAQMIIDDNFEQYKSFLEAVATKKKKNKQKTPKEIIDNLCFFFVYRSGSFENCAGLVRVLTEHRKWNWIEYTLEFLKKYIKKHRPYQIYTTDNIKAIIASEFFTRSRYRNARKIVSYTLFDNFVRNLNVDLNLVPKSLDATFNTVLEIITKITEQGIMHGNAIYEAEMVMRLGAKPTAAHCISASACRKSTLLKVLLKSLSPEETQGATLELAYEKDIPKENLLLLIENGFKVSPNYDAYKYASYLASYGLLELYQAHCKKMFGQDSQYLDKWPDDFNPIRQMTSSRHFDPSCVEILSFIINCQARLIKILPMATLGNLYLHCLKAKIRDESNENYRPHGYQEPKDDTLERPLQFWTEAEIKRLFEILDPLSKMLGGINVLPFTKIFTELLKFPNSNFIKLMMNFLLKPENGIVNPQHKINGKTIVEYVFQIDLKQLFQTSQGKTILRILLEKNYKPDILLALFLNSFVQDNPVLGSVIFNHKEILKGASAFFNQASIKSQLNPVVVEDFLKNWCSTFSTYAYPFAGGMLSLLTSLLSAPMVKPEVIFNELIKGYNQRISKKGKTYEYLPSHSAETELREHQSANEALELTLTEFLLSQKINPLIKQKWNNNTIRSFLEMIAQSNLNSNILTLHQEYFLQSNVYKNHMSLAIKKVKQEAIYRNYLGNSYKEIGYRVNFQESLVLSLSQLYAQYLSPLPDYERVSAISSYYSNFSNDYLKNSLLNYAASVYIKKYNLNPMQTLAHQKLVDTHLNFLSINLSVMFSYDEKCKDNELLWDLPEFQAYRAVCCFNTYCKNPNEFLSLRQTIGLTWHHINDDNKFPSEMLRKELKQQFIATIIEVGQKVKNIFTKQNTIPSSAIQNILYRILRVIQVHVNSLVQIKTITPADLAREFSSFYLAKFNLLPPDEKIKMQSSDLQSQPIRNQFIEKHKSEFFKRFELDIFFQVVNPKMLEDVYNYFVLNFYQILNQTGKANQNLGANAVQPAQSNSLLLQFGQQQAALQQHAPFGQPPAAFGQQQAAVGQQQAAFGQQHPQAAPNIQNQVNNPSNRTGTQPKR